MHNQYSPYLLKASLPTAVAAALLSFAQMANSTVTDYSPDFSNAVEISFNEVTATNPTQADRGWFGTTTSSNHCGLEFKLTNSQMRDVDVIGAWRTSSGTYDSQVRENKLLIAGSNVNVKRVMGSYLGEDTVDNAISVFDNVLEISEGQTRECQDFCVWGGYSRGSPTRLPFVFEMQYARPDAIAGAKVEGPARSAGGSSLAPAIARREAAGALAREV